MRHHSHLTRALSASDVAEKLADYITRSREHPYLHPDSYLSSAGVSFSVTSGPKGGLALHHLGRIEAGLRGESLKLASKEDLRAQFGVEDEDEELQSSDDRALDHAIGNTMRKKRKQKEVQEWVAQSESEGYGDGVPREVESFANTPMHTPFEWQDQQEYELQQTMLEGELGERDGAPVVKQNGIEPGLLLHDSDGNLRRGTRVKVERDDEGRKIEKEKRSKSEKMKLERIDEDIKTKAESPSEDAKMKIEDALEGPKVKLGDDFGEDKKFHVGGSNGTRASAVDKEERRRLKKQRRLEEKRKMAKAGGKG